MGIELYYRVQCDRCPNVMTRYGRATQDHAEMYLCTTYEQARERSLEQGWLTLAPASRTGLRMDQDTLCPDCRRVN